MQRHSRGICLEVRSGAVTLDSVAPLGYLPLELHLWLGSRFGQANLHAVSRRLDVAAQVYNTGQRGRPQSGNRATARIQSQVLARAFVVPARRHCPAIVAVEVAFLRLRDRRLIPGMVFVNRVAEGG